MPELSGLLTVSVNNLSDIRLHCEMRGGDRLPFVEILWDNFCHLSPQDVKAALQPLSDRAAIHVMWSRFLEVPESDLKPLLGRIRAFADTLDSPYISDHLCRFSLNGHFLPSPVELAYDESFETAIDRIKLYQEVTSRPLLLENFASACDTRWPQSQFVRELVRSTGCGLLFDVSNAVIAELNGSEPVDAWADLLSEPTRCHVGGYRFESNSKLFVDSHSEELSEHTLAAVEKLSQRGSITSLCYERDYNKSPQAILADLAALARRMSLHE